MANSNDDVDWRTRYTRREAENFSLHQNILQDNVSEIDNVLARDQDTIPIEDRLVYGTDSKGRPHLSTAAYYGKIGAARPFLKWGADVNRQDSDGFTALHFAIQNNNRLEMSKLLLDNGANPLIKNIIGKTALDFATRQARSNPERNYGPIIALLKRAMAGGPGEDVLKLKCTQNNDDEEGALIDNITLEPLDPSKEILVTEDGYCFKGESLRQWYTQQGQPENPNNRQVGDTSRLTNCFLPLDFDTQTGRER